MNPFTTFVTPSSTSGLLTITTCRFVAHWHIACALLFSRDSRSETIQQQGMAPVKAEHKRRMALLTEESGLDDKLTEVEALAKQPVGTTKYNLLSRCRLVYIFSHFVGLTLLSVLGWFYIFNFIQDRVATRGLFGKLLQAILAIMTFIVSSWVLAL